MRIIEKEKLLIVVDKAAQASRHATGVGELSLCAACTDYTSSNEYDSPESVRSLIDTAIEAESSGLPHVASICVFPSLVESAGIGLGESPIGISAVCGAFPHGQTYIEVKMLECAMAIENGADEIEIVLNLAAMLEGDADIARSEIETIFREMAGEALLKVTLETGALVDPKTIYLASRIAMDAGADFIKTSTCKIPISATGPAAAVMCLAIGDHYKAAGRKAGFIAAGGVDRIEDALFYAGIVREMLGEEWLDPDLFRISGSKILTDTVRRFREL